MPDLAELNIKVTSKDVGLAATRLLRFNERADKSAPITQRMVREFAKLTLLMVKLAPLMGEVATSMGKTATATNRMVKALTALNPALEAVHLKPARLTRTLNRQAAAADRAKTALGEYRTEAKAVGRTGRRRRSRSGISGRGAEEGFNLGGFASRVTGSLGRGNPAGSLLGAGLFGIGSAIGPGGLIAVSAITVAFEAAQAAVAVFVRSVAAAGAGLLALGTASVVAFAKFERLENVLRVLTKDAALARDTFVQLRKFAAITPLRLPDLLGAQRRLLAYNFEAKEALRFTKLLGQVASVSANPGGDIQALALAAGQINQRGRLQGQEIRQLSERGIGIEGELSRLLGVDGTAVKELVEAGRISAQLALLAIENEIKTRFPNVAQELSKDLQGRFSTLLDETQVALADIGQAISSAFAIPENLVKLTRLVERLGAALGGTIRILNGDGTPNDFSNKSAVALAEAFVKIDKAATPAAAAVKGLVGGAFDLFRFGTPTGQNATLIGRLVGSTDAVKDVKEAVRLLDEAASAGGSGSQYGGEFVGPRRTPQDLLTLDKDSVKKVDDFIRKVRAQRAALSQTSQETQALRLEQQFGELMLKTYGTGSEEAAKKTRMFKDEMAALREELEDIAASDAFDKFLAKRERMESGLAGLTRGLTRQAQAFSQTESEARRSAFEDKIDDITAALGDEQSPSIFRSVNRARKAFETLEKVLAGVKFDKSVAAIEKQERALQDQTFALSQQIVLLGLSGSAADTYSDRMRASSIASRIFADDTEKAAAATETLFKKLQALRAAQDAAAQRAAVARDREQFLQTRDAARGDLREGLGALGIERSQLGLSQSGRVRDDALRATRRAAEAAFPGDETAVQRAVDQFARTFDEVRSLEQLTNLFDTVELGFRDAITDGLMAAIFNEDWREALSQALRSIATDAMRTGLNSGIDALIGKDSAGNQQSLAGILASAFGGGGGGTNANGTDGFSQQIVDLGQAGKASTLEVTVLNVPDEATADVMMSKASSRGATAVVAKGSGQPGITAGRVKAGRR